MQLNTVELNVLNELADGNEDIAQVLYQLKNELKDTISEKIIVESVKRLEAYHLIKFLKFDEGQNRYCYIKDSSKIDWENVLFVDLSKVKEWNKSLENKVVILSLTELGRKELYENDWYQSEL